MLTEAACSLVSTMSSQKKLRLLWVGKETDENPQIKKMGVYSVCSACSVLSDIQSFGPLRIVLDPTPPPPPDSGRKAFRFGNELIYEVILYPTVETDHSDVEFMRLDADLAGRNLRMKAFNNWIAASGDCINSGGPLSLERGAGCKVEFSHDTAIEGKCSP